MRSTHGKIGINILRWITRSGKNAAQRNSSSDNDDDDDSNDNDNSGGGAAAYHSDVGSKSFFQNMISPPPLTEASGFTEDDTVIVTPPPPSHGGGRGARGGRLPSEPTIPRPRTRKQSAGHAPAPAPTPAPAHAHVPAPVPAPVPVPSRARLPRHAGPPRTPAIGNIPLPASPNPPPAIRSRRRHTQSLPVDSPRPRLRTLVPSHAHAHAQARAHVTSHPPAPAPAPAPQQPQRTTRARRTSSPHRPFVVNTTAMVLAKPIPVKAQAAITIHAILAHDPKKRVKLLYDLALPSKFARHYPSSSSSSLPIAVQHPFQRLLGQRQHYTPPQPLTPAMLNEPATHPPVARLRIVADQLYYSNWEIVVAPYGRDAHSHSFVRVSDVLACLHTSLRTQVTRAEYSMSPENFRRQVRNAYKRRCEVWEDLMQVECEEERGNGVRRVDFLLDMSVFVGLVRMDEGLANTMSREVTTWVMKLEPLDE